MPRHLLWTRRLESTLLGHRGLVVKRPGQPQGALAHTLPSSPSESWRLWLPRPGPQPSLLHSWVTLRTWPPSQRASVLWAFACCCCQMLMGVWEAGRNVLVLGQVETGLWGGVGRRGAQAFRSISRWQLWVARSKLWAHYQTSPGPSGTYVPGPRRIRWECA